MAAEERERASLREELANTLAAHTSIEEEIFYPAAMEALGPHGRIREGYEEHALADYALYRLLSVSPMDETFAAKLSALKEVVMNHVEEEESELLPQTEGEMTSERLQELGERLEARFAERLTEGARPLLEKSLGIAARSATKTAQRGAETTKRAAAAPAKRTQSRKATTTKRSTAAAAPAKRTQSRKATTQKTPARGQGMSRAQQKGTASRSGTNRGNATGARSATQGRKRAGR
jgi:hypothetical protein